MLRLSIGSLLPIPHHHFLDPLVEDLALLLSLGPLGEDLSLPLAAASVLEAVLGAEVVGVPDLALLGCQGGNTCWMYGVAWAASCPPEVGHGPVAAGPHGLIEACMV